MLSILRERDFSLLWSAQLLSALGDWMMIVAVPAYVYYLTGSALSTGLAFVAETLPALLFGLLAGVFVDRWDRRVVIMVCDLLRGIIILAMLTVNDPNHVWLLYLVAFAESTVTQLFQPAHRAVLPTIVGRNDDLAAANALYSFSNGTVRLIGAPLGGVVYALLGFHVLVLLDSLSYLVSTVMVLAMTRRSYAAAGLGTDKALGEVRPQTWIRRILAEVSYGIWLIMRNRGLRSLLVISSTYLLANGAVTAVLMPYVVEDLGGGARELGFLLSALGVGYLVGAPVAKLLSDPRLLRPAIAGSLVMVGGCFAVVFNSHHLVVALVFIGIAGLPGSIVLTVIQTQVQRSTGDEVLGRVSSAFLTLDRIATVVGATAAGLIAQGAGLSVVLNGAAAVIVAAGIALPLILQGAGSIQDSLRAIPENTR